MSQREPNDCYVYQPDRPTGESDPKIFAIGGPGSDKYANARYTRSEANRKAEFINAAGKKESCCECGGDYPRADLLRGEILCKKCRRDSVLDRQWRLS